MDEQIQKDIDFCREHKYAHQDIYLRLNDKAGNAHMATLLLPLCSSTTAFFMSLGTFKAIPKGMLGCIMIASGLSTTLSALYLHPDQAEDRVKHREAFVAYSDLKVDLELFNVSKGLYEENSRNKRYQKFYKRKQQLIRQYPPTLLNE